MTFPMTLASQLCRRLKQRAKEAEVSTLETAELSEAAGPELVDEWTRMAKYAMSNRNRIPEAMDVYNVQMDKGTSHRAVIGDAHS